MPDLRIKPLGDTALRIDLGDAITPAVNRRVRAACADLERAALPGVVEWVPSYTAVTVYYKPHVVRFRDLCRAMEQAIAPENDLPVPEGRLVTLPVLYGGERGPDLEFVALHHQLSVEDVIRLHSEPEYLVYMIGFAPGYPYLGGLSERIATPRLEKPRLSVPKGSVGIGGSQTGVYSVDSPGGWRLIGWTPITLYDPRKDRPTLLEAGDRVRFRPATAEECAGLAAKEPAR
ncbi:MAG: 5-oxoprolinase subunit PxpB [Planctomycetota bacterium]|nr:MAG: 5-oxoprolinase subunit PxpB [Planctomycetota bacterium]